MDIGETVRVMTRNGAVGYVGKVVRIVPGNYGRVHVETPDDGETHDVPAAYVKPFGPNACVDHAEDYPTPEALLGHLKLAHAG